MTKNYVSDKNCIGPYRKLLVGNEAFEWTILDSESKKISIYSEHSDNEKRFRSFRPGYFLTCFNAEGSFCIENLCIEGTALFSANSKLTLTGDVEFLSSKSDAQDLMKNVISLRCDERGFTFDTPFNCAGDFYDCYDNPFYLENHLRNYLADFIKMEGSMISKSHEFEANFAFAETKKGLPVVSAGLDDLLYLPDCICAKPYVVTRRPTLKNKVTFFLKKLSDKTVKLNYDKQDSYDFGQQNLDCGVKLSENYDCLQLQNVFELLIEHAKNYRRRLEIFGEKFGTY